MHQQIRNKWIHFTLPDILCFQILYHGVLVRLCLLVHCTLRLCILLHCIVRWYIVLSDCVFCYITLHCQMVRCSLRLCRAVCEGRLTNVLAAAGREEPALQLQLTPVLLRQHHHQDGEAWQLQRWISWPLGPIQRITIIQFHIVSIIWPLLYLISYDNTNFISLVFPLTLP